MVDPEAKTFDPRNLRAEYLEHSVAILGKAGVRLAFPEQIETAQSLWLEDCPLSDQELRAEMREVLAEIDRLARRVGTLRDRLPNPHEFQFDNLDDLPASLYLRLHSALSFLLDDSLKRSAEVISEALAATPEGIRTDWLNRQLSDEQLRQLIPETGS